MRLINLLTDKQKLEYFYQNFALFTLRWFCDTKKEFIILAVLFLCQPSKLKFISDPVYSFRELIVQGDIFNLTALRKYKEI